MMTKDNFIEKYAHNLNQKQLQAVQTVKGPVLLLAVPGSGKTTVLVNRLGYMLMCEGISPSKILTLTYTVAATRDMKERFQKIFGEECGANLEFRTINGICSKIISRYGQIIGKVPFELINDEKILAKVIADILVKYMSEYPTESDIKATKTLITYCKNMVLDQTEIEKLGEAEGIPLFQIYKEYNEYLKNHHQMDYDDQMVYAYRMLRASKDLLDYYRNQYEYICIDEAQDTSKIQHMIIGLLAGTNGNIFMVGDEDQSIYGFRAAYPAALLDFQKNYPNGQILVMNQNYRSNGRIVDMAHKLIRRNKDRHDKTMEATREQTSPIRYIEMASRACQYSYLTKVAADISRETAVLYRDNESVLPLIDQLDRLKLPYRIKGGDMTFFTHRVVMDIANIIKFAENPYDTELFMKIYFKCKTYLKKSQAENLCNISRERDIPVLEAVEYLEGINGGVVGQCKSLNTHLKKLLKESPAKALYRIETPMGYGDYLERNNIDNKKIFVLKMIGSNEVSLTSLLTRLEYLQEILKNGSIDKECQFILSTIHSSKGLEYDRVYLMDICDGVFPSNSINTSNRANDAERKAFEEERRILYVAITRAKNELNLFTFKDSSSVFAKEIQQGDQVYLSSVKNTSDKPDKVKISKKYNGNKKPTSYSSTKTEINVDLNIGTRVVQKIYGAGSVNNIIYNENGKVKSFGVVFDNGEVRNYGFPMAFEVGMKLEKE